MPRRAGVYRFLLLSTAMILVSRAPADAQERTTGQVQVVVKDEQGLVVPGATVTLLSPTGNMVRVSDDRGRAIFPFLPPGMHDVRVELPGFASVTYEGIAVRTNATAEVNVTLRAAGVQESVTVTGEAPVLDRLSTTIGESVTDELLEHIPVNRNFTVVAGLSAGVSDPGKIGENNPSVGGASGLENAYFVDGVNITNTGYGGVGSFSPTFGSLGSAVNFDFVEEVQVKTGGYEAEYGQALGGVVNVVTKSGTNNLRGSGFGYFQLAGLEGTRTQPNASLVVPTVEETQAGVSDFGFAAGGPIAQDKVFWFGAVNPIFSTRTRTVPSDFITASEGGILEPGDFPLAHLGDVDLETRTVSYSGKLSYNFRADHRLDFTAFGDPSHTELGPIRESALLNPNNETTGFSELDFGGNNVIGRYSGVFEKFFVEAVLSRAFNKTRENFPPENNLHQITDLTRGGLVSGGIGQKTDNESRNIQAGAKMTYLAGAHQVKFGYHFEDISFLEDFSIVGPTFSVVDSSGARRETFGGAQILKLADNLYRVRFADLTPSEHEATANYHSAFVQDTWTANDRLTVNVGLRYDYERLQGTAGEMTLPASWAPRIGATFDFRGDGSSKIYGHWGRYYQKVPLTLATKLLSEGTKLTQADYFDADLTQQVPGAPVLTGAAFIAQVDPDMKGMYQDEVVAGLELETAAKVSLGGRFIYRDLGRVVEDISNVTIPFLFTGRFSDFSFIFTNPGAGNEKFLVQEPNNVGIVGEPVREYKAFELTMRKRLSNRWQALASYRLSSLEGNYEGFQRNDSGTPNPAANPTFDFPATVSDPLTQPDPDVFYFYIPGPLNTDRRHSIKVFGSYVFGGKLRDLNLGYGVEASSGAPITPFVWNPVYNRADFPGAARGSLGRTDWIGRFDVHADYPIRWGGDRALRLIVDAFNITNAQNVLRVEEAQVIGADVDNPNFLAPVAYQFPRRVRFGLRFEF